MGGQEIGVHRVVFVGVGVRPPQSQARGASRMCFPETGEDTQSGWQPPSFPMSFEDREYAWYEERVSLLRALEESERANEFLRGRERAFREKEALLLAERNTSLRKSQRAPGLYESRQSAEESRKERAREALSMRTLQFKLERAEARASHAERALKERDFEAKEEARELRERINVLEGRLALLGTLRTSALSVDVIGGLAGAPTAVEGVGISRRRAVPVAAPPPPPTASSSGGGSKSPTLDSLKRPFHTIAPAGMRNTPFAKGLEATASSPASSSSSGVIVKDAPPLSPSPTIEQQQQQPSSLKSGRKSPTSTSPSSSASTSPSGGASKALPVPPPPVPHPSTTSSKPSSKPKSTPGRMMLSSPRQGGRAGTTSPRSTTASAAAPPSPFSVAPGADHSPEKFKQRVKEFMLNAMGMEAPPPSPQFIVEGSKKGEEVEENGEEKPLDSQPQPPLQPSLLPERVWGGIRVKSMVIKRDPPTAPPESGAGGGVDVAAPDVPPPVESVGGAPSLWSKHRAVVLGDSDGQIKSYGM